MNIVNLLPHDFTLCDDAGNVILSIPPTEPAARVSSITNVIGEIDGIPITSIDFGEIKNLPEPRAGTIYIVSLLVQQAAPHRKDLYRPDTSPGNVVRDDAGQIIGVKALAVL
jgi:hypothetical protein